MSKKINIKNENSVTYLTENMTVNNADSRTENSNITHQQDVLKAFIIHGHDKERRFELKDILWKLGVEPIVLTDDGLNGRTIMENIEVYAKECAMAFAVFTYDDIVKTDDREYLQVRPNVIFELGYFYAMLGRENVMILSQETQNKNIFSDIDGIYRYEFSNKIAEHQDKIIKLVNSFKMQK